MSLDHNYYGKNISLANILIEWKWPLMQPYGKTGVGGNKLRIYSCFKNIYKVESYITNNVPQKCTR